MSAERTSAERRPARVLAVSEAQIPSAVLGVNAVFEHLARDGRSCELRVATSIELDPRDLAWADSVVLVRGASPAERRILGEARRLGRFVATYMDDDLERVPPGARSAFFFGSPRVAADIAAILRSADAVYVCSERLGAVLSERHRRATTLLRQPRPPRLPEELGPPPSVAAATNGAAGDGAPIAIGFLGSVDHTAFIESLLARPLTALVRERRDSLRLVFCGANPPFAWQLDAHCESFDLDFTAWRRRAFELGISIGLAPLPDTPFHRCKYFNKYLEYGSLGIVGIYSAVPPSADAVVDGETGLLCPNEPAAWSAALLRLVDDRALRARLARAAYEDVERRFSAEALEPGWRDTLAPLLAHRAPDISRSAVRLWHGPFRHALDRLAVYGPRRFAERAVGRLTGRLRPG
ncbi:MAG TPA: glycosyltransferase [Candidatus Binatia bacterium]|nr:glycosyltransferase [Candidatus Binatia bacterium]